MPTTVDVVVVGAGAAGLMCAIEAGKRGRRVRVLERSRQAGSKILISGGGNCNFTNLEVTKKNFVSGNPDFCRSALSRYDQNKFIDLVRSYEIEFYEKKKGQLFCRGGAKQILSMLLTECERAEVRIECGINVKRIAKDGRFVVETDDEVFDAESVVIATGGASIPQMGATTFAYGIAEQFGLSVTAPKPGLVPIVWNEQDALTYEQLAGVALPVRVWNSRISFDDDMLFTHKGLSGPAILQISSYWNAGESIHVDLSAGRALAYSPDALRIHGGPVIKLLERILPRRMAALWQVRLDITKSLSQLSVAELTQISSSLIDWEIYPAGTEGFKKAEVTVGGVDTRGLSSKTMEARDVPGLFFIGEGVDVTGWLGGYNFQWAWSSGWAAGQFV